jgi:N-acetyl-beta-hexosaminidase
VGRLQRSAARYLRYLNLSHSSGSTSSLEVCTVTLASLNDELSIDTNYSYTLQISDASCNITAASTYGAMYAFETFTQLVNSPAGFDTTAPINSSSPYLPHATVTIVDSPMYRHRSLMIDAGMTLCRIC